MRPLFGAIATALLVAAGILFRGELTAWMRLHPAFFPAFVFAAQLSFVPRIVTLVLSGLLFSPATAVAFTLAGDMAAAMAVWALGRWSFLHAAETLIVRPELVRVRHFLTRRAPLASVAILRILPVSHFSTVSMVSGMLGIPLPAYAAGTLLGCLPTAIFWASAGFWLGS